MRHHLDRVDVDDQTGCWNWRGRVAENGYPRMHDGYAHRIYFEQLRGPIPDGLTLDHLCRNTRCVNPEHLQVVTHQVNILRGDGVAALNARRTHCRQGHEFTPENTIVRQRADRHPWRECRTCKVGWAAMSRERRAARDA